MPLQLVPTGPVIYPPQSVLVPAAPTTTSQCIHMDSSGAFSYGTCMGDALGPLTAQSKHNVLSFPSGVMTGVLAAVLLAAGRNWWRRRM